MSYIGLALGEVPWFRMNRATIALVGSALLIALGALSLEDAWRAIDATTIVFLLSMMVVNANLTYAGFFQLSLTNLLRVTRSPFGLMVMLTWGSGVLSALFLNDTIAIVFTPLVLHLTRSLGLNPIPYLLALAGATNIGSVATLSGNPQNILIGSFSQISYVDFAAALIPVAIAGLIIQIVLLWLMFPEVRSRTPLPTPLPQRLRLHKPLLLKTLIVTVGLLMAFVVGWPLAESALVAAAILLVTRRVKPHRTLMAIDWSLLVMFSGLFVLTRCTQTFNVLAWFANWTDSAAGLLGVTALLSNLISNVPAVLLLYPLIAPERTQNWLLLAAGSTLAGNLTLFGSVANLIMAEAANRLGYRLSFWEHLRFGVPLTLLTLLMTYWQIMRN